jgi:hypothetical protein
VAFCARAPSFLNHGETILNRLIVLLLAAGLLTSGCSGWKDSKVLTASKGLYKGYINTDPSIDLKDDGLGNPGQEKLARLFCSVDQRLYELARTIDDRNSFPEERWFDQVLSSHSWLSGAGAVDKEGSVIMRKPPEGMKVPNYGVLLQKDVLYPERSLRAGVEQTPLGPELYLGSPFYNNNSWLGLLVVHFDMGSLVRLSPSPDEIMILHEGGVLWPGKGFDQQGITAIDWAEMLKRRVSGRIELKGEDYHWMARYLGQLRLVYLVREG